MYGKTGTACISLTQNVQKSDQVLDKVRARRIIVRSFVRVTHAQNTKSVKQLNNRGRTNPLRKKASALRLCRIFFAAEPCSRSAFLLLRSLVSALREQTHNGKHAGTCRGKRLAAGASPSADFNTLFPHIRAKSFGTNIFLLCRYAFCTGHKRRRANNPVGIHAVLKRTAQMAPLAWAPSLLRKLARHMTLSSQF